MLQAASDANARFLLGLAAKKSPQGIAVETLEAGAMLRVQTSSGTMCLIEVIDPVLGIVHFMRCRASGSAPAGYVGQFVIPRFDCGEPILYSQGNTTSVIKIELL